MNSKKEQFIDRLRHENIALVYQEDWRKKSTGHLRIDLSNPNLIRQCSLVEHSEVVEMDNGESKIGIGPELLSVLNGKMPIQVMSVVNGLLRGKHNANKEIVKLDTTHCKVRRTEATLHKIYELELGKMLAPDESMTNFFTKECQGDFTDETLEIFCEQFGYFFPQYLSFGARHKKCTVSQLNTTKAVMNGDILGAVFNRSAQGSIVSTNELYEGCEAKELTGLMSKFDPDQIVLLEAKGFTPVIELLPLEQKIRIKKLGFYQTRLREPSIMTINKTSLQKNKGFTGPVGDAQGQEVSVFEEGYSVVSITGFWDKWDSAKEIAAHPFYNLWGYVAKERKLPPKKFWQRLIRVLVVLQDQNGNKIERNIGKEGSWQIAAGSINLDPRKDVVQELQLGLDYLNGGIAYIAVRTHSQEQLQVVGREDLVNASTLKKFRIGGRLLGIRGRSNNLIQQLEGIYEINSMEADMEVSRFVMK